MPNAFPANPVPWRVLLLRRNATEVFALETDSGLVLPEIEIPQGCRVARALNQSIRERWKIDAYSLYPFVQPTAPESRFYVVEALRDNTVAPESSTWLPLAAIESSRPLCDPADCEAIRRWSRGLSASAESAGRFATPGWLSTSRNWAAECLEKTSLRLTGNFVQCNASPKFSLIRFETDRGAVWFKAVGEPNLREYAITALLAAELPSYLPQILGMRPDWHAWLALEADGMPLSQTNESPAWRQAVRDLAAMQQGSRHLVEALLPCGARDLRTGLLLSETNAFFPFIRELMARQITEHPPRLTGSEIDLLEEDLRGVLEFLERDSVPDTLLHLDLHPDNLIAVTSKTLFLDWAEGAVGHPFLSLAYFLEHFRRHFLDSDRVLDALTREYLQVWAPKNSADMRMTLYACPLAALFAYAISSGANRDKILNDSDLAGYYRSLARRMKRYAERFRSEVGSFREVVA
jgi:hypothetical protein